MNSGYRTPFTVKQRTICAEYWADVRTRCSGCPLFTPCSAPLAGPMTLASIDAYAAQLNEAAERVQ